MSATTPGQSFARYRPVILVVTGAFLAYGSYCLYTNLSNKGKRQTSLHRSNAIRRPRRRHREEQSHSAWPQRPSLETRDLLDIGIRFTIGEDDYGALVRIGDHGPERRIDLSLQLPPTVEQLRDDLEYHEEVARQVQPTIQRHLLRRYFQLHFPIGVDLDATEAEAMRQTMVARGYDRDVFDEVFERHNRRHNSESSEDIASLNGANQQNPMAHDELARGESDASWDQPLSWTEANEHGQNLKSMLYFIAEEQARQDGYVHRGVTCNSCDVKPIRGVRWRCANCPDYDLCSDCEALNLHPRTHIFYKVKIPAPFLGSPRQAQPVFYPGKPHLMADTLPPLVKKRLTESSKYESSHMEALWDQFTCLANVQWLQDPNKLGGAIDRRAFEKSFVPNSSVSPPAPNLIYDRLFAFFDTNADQLIGFEEFVHGMSHLRFGPKLKQVFSGYDIDGDGYVSRKDFLRMFRAYYVIQKEITQDIIAVQDDDLAVSGALDIISSSQPLSAAFTDIIPPGERSVPQGKSVDNFGDRLPSVSEIVLESSEDLADRNEIIKDIFGAVPTATSSPSIQPEVRWEEHPNADDGLPEPDNADGGFAHPPPSPPGELNRGSVSAEQEQLSSNRVPQEPVTSGHVPEEGRSVQSPQSPTSNQQMETQQADNSSSPNEELPGTSTQLRESKDDALWERWRRRQFYVDEEEGFSPPPELEEKLNACEQDRNTTTHASDMEDQESVPRSRALSPRSRSSSKVRFQDDPEVETRSNASTSSRPVGERWGGYEIPEAEKDVGKEVLYQVTQQALNELLDPLFIEKEDLAMEVSATRKLRQKLRPKVEKFLGAKKMGPKLDEHLAQELLLWRAAVNDNAESPTAYLAQLWKNRDINKAADETNGQIAGTGGRHTDTRSPKDDSANMSQNPSQSTETKQSGWAKISDFDDTSALYRPLSELIEESGYGMANKTSRNFLPLDPIGVPFPKFARQNQNTSSKNDLGTSQARHSDLIIPSTSDQDSIALITSSPKLRNSDSLLSGIHHGNDASPESLIDAISSIPPHVQQDIDPRTLETSSSPPPGHQTLSGNEAERSLITPGHRRKARHDAREGGKLPSRRASAPAAIPRGSRPSEALLLRLALLDAEEREMRKRGGGGRLSFEEFEALLQTDRGRSLGFVEGWLELASF